MKNTVRKSLALLLALALSAGTLPSLSSAADIPMDSDWDTVAITTDTLDLTEGLESRPVMDFYAIVNTLLGLDYIGQIRRTELESSVVFDLDKDGTDDLMLSTTPDGKTTTFQLLADYSLDKDCVFTLNSTAIDYLRGIQSPGYCEELVIKLPVPAAPVSFQDVPADAYYAQAVAWAVENGITTGTGPDTFSPDVDCTRGQVVTFLWRAVRCPEPKTVDNPFKDVKEEDYFCKAVLWAVENSISSGTSGTTFSPNAPCTRAQVVTFLFRLMSASIPEDPMNPFNDVKEGDYFYEPVLWAVAAQITSGSGDSSFAPDAPCTRAQVVTFLNRALGGTWTKWETDQD